MSIRDNSQNQKIENLSSRFAAFTGNIMDIKENGVYYVTQSSTGKPATHGGLLVVGYGSENNSVRLFIPITSANSVYIRTIINGTDNGWNKVI